MFDHYNFSHAKNMPARGQYVTLKMADDLVFAAFHCGRLSAVVVAIHPILGTLPAQSTKIHPSFNKILTNLNRGQTFGICTEMKSYNQIMYDQLNKIFCSLTFIQIEKLLHLAVTHYALCQTLIECYYGHILKEIYNTIKKYH